MPIVRRIPKRGFNNRFAETVVIVNLGVVDRNFQAGEEVTPDTLRAKRILRGSFDAVKVLGNGELTKSVNISAHQFSRTALEKIEKAGAKAVVLPGKAPVVKNKMRAKTKRV